MKTPMLDAVLELAKVAGMCAIEPAEIVIHSTPIFDRITAECLFNSQPGAEPSAVAGPGGERFLVITFCGIRIVREDPTRAAREA